MKAKQLLGSILTQLYRHKRRRQDGYAEVCRSCEPTAFIILDDCQLIARSSLLQTLVRCRERCGANVAVVMVSALDWGCGEYTDLPPMPRVVFGNYDGEQAASVLQKHKPSSCSEADEPLYRNFCETLVYNEFSQMSRDMRHLMSLAAFFWPIYMAPIKERKVPASAGLQQKVRQLRSPALLALVKEVQKLYEPGMSRLALQQLLSMHKGGVYVRKDSDTGGGLGQHGAESISQLELPSNTQILLILPCILAHLTTHFTATLHSGTLDINLTATLHSGTLDIDLTATLHSGTLDIDLTATLHSGTLDIDLTATLHSGTLDNTLDSYLAFWHT
eukprot:gene10888-17010_t